MNEQEIEKLKNLLSALNETADYICHDNLLPFAMKFGQIHEYVNRWYKEVSENNSNEKK